MTEEPEIYEPNFIFFKRIFEAFKVQGVCALSGPHLMSMGCGDMRLGSLLAYIKMEVGQENEIFQMLCLLSSLMM